MFNSGHSLDDSSHDLNNPLNTASSEGDSPISKQSHSNQVTQLVRNFISRRKPDPIETHSIIPSVSSYTGVATNIKKPKPKAENFDIELADMAEVRKEAEIVKEAEKLAAATGNNGRRLTKKEKKLERKLERNNRKSQAMHKEIDGVIVYEKKRSGLLNPRSETANYSWLYNLKILDNRSRNSGTSSSPHTTAKDSENFDRPRTRTSGFAAFLKSANITFFERKEQPAPQIQSHNQIKELKKKFKFSKRFYINPKSKKKIIWDVLISLTLVYYAFVVPVMWSQAIFGDIWVYIDYALDAIIWIDIILSFFTGIAMNKFTIRSRRQIAKRYIRTRLFWDLIAAIPNRYIGQDFVFMKSFRLIHTKRLYNLLQKVGLLFLGGMMAMNFLMHLFRFCTILNYLAALCIYFERIHAPASLGWFSTYNGTFPPTNDDPVSIHILGSHFVVETVATVGYGDAGPKTVPEMLTVMIYMFVGMIITALLQTKFAQFIQNTRKSIQVERIENKNFNNWVGERMVSKQKYQIEVPVIKLSEGERLVFKNIREFFRFSINNSYRRHTLDNYFFKKLPLWIQNRVSREIFPKIVNRFKTFFDLFTDIHFKQEVLWSMKPKTYEKHEVIYRAGSKPKGLFFLQNSRAFLFSDGVEHFVAEDGFYFGEFLVLDITFNFDFIAAEDSTHCFYIPDDEIREICSRYPDSLSVLEKMVFRRFDYFEMVMSKNQKNQIARKSSLDMILSERSSSSSFKRRGLKSPTRIKPKGSLEFFLESNTEIGAESEADKAKKDNMEDGDGDACVDGAEPEGEVGDEKDLDDSFDIPLEEGVLEFKVLDEAEQIANYLEEKIEKLELKANKVQSSISDIITKECASIKRVIKQILFEKIVRTVNKIRGLKR